MKESTKKEEGTVIAAAKFTDNKRRESHIKRRDMEEGAKSHSWRRSRSNKGVAYWILATTSKTHRKTLQDNRIWSLKCSRWLRKYYSLYAVNELTAEREKLKKTEIVIKSRSSVCRIYRFFLKIFFAKYSYLPCNVLITNAMNNSCNQFLFHSVLPDLHVSNESSRSSSGERHNILYYTVWYNCADESRIASTIVPIVLCYTVYYTVLLMMNG